MKFTGGPIAAGFVASLLLLSQACESNGDVVPGSDRKRNTGHYVSLNRFDKREVIADVALPGVSGIQRRYYWKSLEPEFGRYDLSEVHADLEAAREQGLQLVVFIEDKSFNGEIPTPPYLQGTHTVKNRSGGFIAVRWDPYVKKRFKALIAEIGRQFDTDPNFEGVAIQESAPSLDRDVLAERRGLPTSRRLLGSADHRCVNDWG